MLELYPDSLDITIHYNVTVGKPSEGLFGCTRQCTNGTVNMPYNLRSDKARYLCSWPGDCPVLFCSEKICCNTTGDSAFRCHVFIFLSPIFHSYLYDRKNLSLHNDCKTLLRKNLINNMTSLPHQCQVNLQVVVSLKKRFKNQGYCTAPVSSQNDNILWSFLCMSM